MFKFIAVRHAQGTQFIPDLRQAQATGLRGLPTIGTQDCANGCQRCVQVCPSQAISLAPLAIDMGRCVLCGDCAPACPNQTLGFSSDFRMASADRAGLVVSAARPTIEPVQVAAALHRRFGRSLKLRSVSAGGCNGCEMEINALGNVNFDLGRYGIDIVASPRHADGLVLSGPISRNMVQALHQCWDAMPNPKLVIAVGACAISGGVFTDSDAIDREFLARVQPSLYLPGCPTHPLTFISGILDLLGIAT